MGDLVRIARACPKEGCPWREFGDPEARCPQHGKGYTQENRPYRGRPVEQAPGYEPPRRRGRG